MQLWTIHSQNFCEALQHEKVLRARCEHVNELDIPAHDWLREQMAQRIGSPPEPDIYPMWAYFQYWDAQKRRPDLRHLRCYYPRGKQQVLMELKVDEKRILLSDHGDWNYVLSNYYFPTSEADSDAFENANHPEEVARTMKLESWQRCLIWIFMHQAFHHPAMRKGFRRLFGSCA